MGRTYICSTCQTQWFSLSHLRRHETTHAPSRQSGCPFCDRTFLRADTARRHAKTCTNRNERPLPDERKRGKPRKACDHCAQAKLGCDGDTPCESCRSNNTLCSYSRLGNDMLQLSLDSEDESPRSGSTNTTSTVSPKTGTGSRPSVSSDPTSLEGERLSIPFLLNYTNKNNATIMDFYQALETSSFGEAGRRSPVLLPRNQFDEDILMLSEIPDDMDLTGLVDNFLLPQSAFDVPTFDFDSLSPISSETSTRLQDRVDEAIQYLAETERSSGMTLLSPDTLNTLFTVTNLHEAIPLFFHAGHPHCPVVHKPSFDPEMTVLPLLVAVFVCGSLHSYPRDNHSLAFECLDLAESCVFEHPRFKSLVQSAQRDSVNPAREEVDLMSAAILICCLQLTGTSSESRWRIRNRRFPEMIAIARAMGLLSVRHPTSDKGIGPLDMSEWQNWSLRETMIRQVTMLVVLDFHFTIIYRIPPRLALAELSTDLPCSEAAYATDDYMQWQMFVSQCETTSISLRSMMAILMADDWSGADTAAFASLTLTGLFTVVSGLHLAIWIAQTGFAGFQQAQRIDRALLRWKELWDQVKARTSIEEIKRLGFTRCGAEMWWFGRVMLRVDPAKAPPFFDKEAMAYLAYLVRTYSNSPVVNT